MSDECSPLPWVGLWRAGIACACGNWVSGPRIEADIKPSDNSDTYAYTLKAAWERYRNEHWDQLHPGKPLLKPPRRRRHDPLQKERLFDPEAQIP